jgi:nucleoside-diphosphate-sugar epimerase
VTGAAGSLGRVVVPELVRRGHLVRAFDQRPLPSLAADGPGSVDEVVGDLRDADTVRALVHGTDAVLHGAAVHGIHRDRFTPRDFWDINATGTFAVYDACRQEGVAKVVLASSMAVYGASSERTDAAWAVVTDDSDVLPNDEYGLSKHGCETMAVDAARAWGIETVALRLGMFVPETFERYGFRLLFGGVDDRDVASAAVLALDYSGEQGFEAFNVFAPTPFTPGEAAPLAADPWAVIDKHWPGTSALVDEQGHRRDDLMWGWALWSSQKAQDILGWQPAYDFSRFFAAWRSGDRTLYPFADQPRWGV